ESKYVDDSGENHIIGKLIYFGNGKQTKLQAESVKWKFDRFGMKYGWLGNRCVITADSNAISNDNIDAFVFFYNQKIEEFKEVLNLVKIRHTILSDKIADSLLNIASKGVLKNL